MTTAAGPEITRPGLSFYVPGVRIVELSPALQGDRVSDPGTELPRDILGDLLHAEVTRVNSGPSKYKLSFNNFFLTTAFDRAQDTGDLPRLGSREIIPGKNPTWPRFKYNDFKLLKFGQRLRIDMRYLPEPVTDTGERDRNTTSRAKDAWVPMVAGPITDMRFTFGLSEGAGSKSRRDDLRRPAQAPRPAEDRGRWRRTERRPDGAEEVIYPLKEIAGPPGPYPSFATTTARSCANRSRRGGPHAPHSEAGQSIRLRGLSRICGPRRSVVAARIPLRAVSRAHARRFPHVLRQNRRSSGSIEKRDLLDFTPTIKLVDQYSEVRVNGRHRDPRLAEAFRGHALFDIVKDELHGSDTLKPAGEARDFFFKARPNSFRIRNESNLDPVRANYQAESVIRRKARECFTI